MLFSVTIAEKVQVVKRLCACPVSPPAPERRCCLSHFNHHHSYVITTLRGTPPNRIQSLPRPQSIKLDADHDAPSSHNAHVRIAVVWCIF